MLSGTGWVDWQNYINNLGGKSDTLWSTYVHNDTPPQNMVTPQLAWNPNCLLYGKSGFTAISQCNSFQGSRGQIPVTALTKRHGYLRGHGNGGNQVGEKVWFCTLDNQVVEATVAASMVRWAINRYDYGLVLFSQDLPPTVTPMLVGYTNQPFAVMFATVQSGRMDGNCPPFNFDEVSRPPFNNVDIGNGGDSGSPNMLSTWDNRLVFIDGRTTTGPCAQMQADTDDLCRRMGLDPANYQMTWYP